MRKILALTLLLAAAAVAFSCGGNTGTSGNSGSTQNPNDTPTEAYKRLFAAIKAKNTDAIRNEMSAKTKEFAKAVAARQNKSEVEVLSNGFTASSFAPTLPEIRDERIKDNMGAIEVWNDKDKRWDELPYIREADGWKLAIGDLFAGTFKSPGAGQSLREQQAINATSSNNGMQMAPVQPGANVNVDSPANRR
jgi:hypothetical protein